jgi:hypothetical protein
MRKTEASSGLRVSVLGCLDDLRSLGQSIQALDRPPKLEVDLREQLSELLVFDPRLSARR